MSKISNITTYNKVFILLLVTCLFVQCSDFFEEDISSQKVHLISPSKGYKSVSYTINFLWDAVDGATEYHLQIVKPSFKAIEVMVNDTFVTNTFYSVNLLPGDYEWAVAAVNASSSTIFYTSKFSIDTSSLLTGTEIKLVSPSDNYYTNSLTTKFKWLKIESATKYSFSIYKDVLDGDIITERTLATDTTSYSLNEGVYFWSIQASNKVSISLISSRKVTIDRTAPGIVQLTTPGDKDTLFTNDDNKLVWRRTGSSLAPVRDSIYVAKDSLFQNIVERGSSDTTIYYLNTNDPAKYFWRVKSIDMAGNVGQFSVYRKFQIEKKK